MFCSTEYFDIDGIMEYLKNKHRRTPSAAIYNKPPVLTGSVSLLPVMMKTADHVEMTPAMTWAAMGENAPASVSIQDGTDSLVNSNKSVNIDEVISYIAQHPQGQPKSTHSVPVDKQTSSSG
jgi:hypothetical protein